MKSFVVIYPNRKYCMNMRKTESHTEFNDIVGAGDITEISR